MCTISGGDVTDDVALIHWNLPVGFLLSEGQGSTFLSTAGGGLDTEKHWALKARYTQPQQVRWSHRR